MTSQFEKLRRKEAKKARTGLGRTKHARRAARRVAADLARGRWRGIRSSDHWVNMWNLIHGSSRADCPVCLYSGPFLQFAGRPRQVCPACEGRARHRAIRLALEAWQKSRGPYRYKTGLQIAPEPCLVAMIESHGDFLFTGDIQPGIAQTALDLRALPLADNSLDFVFASHVLEHVVEDRLALSEVYRVLRPGGLAILVVPITTPVTVEHDAVIAQRNFHARDCGRDYFERYAQAGFEVELFRSDAMPGVDSHALITLVPGGEDTVHWIPFCTKPVGPPRPASLGSL